MQTICDRDAFTTVCNKYIALDALPPKTEGGYREKTENTLSEIALIACTRGMLGAGIGLLLSGRLSKDKRQTAGWWQLERSPQSR